MKLRMYQSLMFYFLSVMLFMSAQFDLRAQNPTVADSLLKSLERTSDPIKKTETLVLLFRESRRVDRVAALKYATQAYNIALEAGDSLTIVKTGNARAWALADNGYVREAVSLFTAILSVSKRNQFTDQVKYLLNNLAISYRRGAIYDKALEYSFESLKLREDEGNMEDISVAYNSIGLIYSKLGDLDNALTNFNQSYKIKSENSISYGLENVLINLGMTYSQLKNSNAALESLQKALLICNNNGCADDVWLELRFTLAEANFEKGDIVKAEEDALNAVSLADHLNESRIGIISRNLMASIRMKQDEMEEAGSYLKDAEGMMAQTDLPDEQLANYTLQSEFYSKKGDFEHASLYHMKYSNLKDSIYHKNLITHLYNIQTQFAERENLKTIEDQNVTLRRTRALNVAVVIIAVLACVIIFVLYRSNEVTKRFNRALSEAKETIEDQNRQLTSMNHELEERVQQRTKELMVSNESLKRVNDELDNFIYKTSHDIRGPLASLKGICNVAIMDIKDEKALDYLRKLDMTAERLNGILTRLLIINQISHAALNNGPIDFENMIEEILFIERKKGVPGNLAIQTEIENDIVFYSDKELVRIILENLIDNAIKFYNDSGRIKPFVNIMVNRQDNHIVIRVIDNGIGINSANPEKMFQMFVRGSERSETGGIGLYLTKTATDKLGGTVGVRNTLEGYTEFYVMFPAAVIWKAAAEG